MLKPSYNITIGKWSINSADDPQTEFVQLETRMSLDSPNDRCRISVYAPPPPDPGLVDQAVGEVAGGLGLGSEAEPSFSVQIRGNDIAHGDLVSVELTSGDVSERVMSADVVAFDTSLGQSHVTGRTGMQKLANTRLNQIYENQSLKQIVNDLAGQADVTIGDIETGSTYPYFVVHETKSVLKHLRQLAMNDGMDLFFDTHNKLTLKAFNKASADHTLHYGIHILDLQVVNHQPSSRHVRVYGESPSSNQGADTWPWLVKDISPFRSDVGQGAQSLALQAGEIRTKDAADQLAKAKFGAMKDRSTSGRIRLLGYPSVQVADAIEIKSAPKPELNGLFKVTSVRHVLNKQEGFLTFLGFTGQGGAQSAGGLLDAVGNAAGAIGL